MTDLERLAQRERELRELLSAAKMAYDHICAPLWHELVRLESLKPINHIVFMQDLKREMMNLTGIDQLAAGSIIGVDFGESGAAAVVSWSRDLDPTDWSPSCQSPSKP